MMNDLKKSLLSGKLKTSLKVCHSAAKLLKFYVQKCKKIETMVEDDFRKLD